MPDKRPGRATRRTAAAAVAFAGIAAVLNFAMAEPLLDAARTGTGFSRGQKCRGLVLQQDGTLNEVEIAGAADYEVWDACRRVMAIANIMFEEYREKRFAPPPLLKQMVLAGRLGRKSGRGFYSYG